MPDALAVLKSHTLIVILSRADTGKMEDFFKPLFDRGGYELPSIASILPMIAGVLDLRDKGLLSLEASTFVRRFADVPTDLLSSIIQIREDIGSKEAKWVVLYSLGEGV